MAVALERVRGDLPQDVRRGAAGLRSAGPVRRRSPDSAAVPGHGRRQRHAGLVLRRRDVARPRCRCRARAGAARRRGRPARRRRGVDPTRCRATERHRGARPGAACRRRRSSAAGAVVSIDTMRAEVARRAVAVGAAVVNDVSGGLADDAMLATVADLGVAYIAMHWRGHSTSMQQRASYDDVIDEVSAELAGPGRRRPGRGHRGRPAGARPRHRLRQAGRAQLGGAAPARRAARAGLPARRRLVAQVLPRRAARGPGRHAAAAARPRRRLGRAVDACPPSRGAWCVRVHDVARSADAVRVAARFGSEAGS